jgi:hypothetical protein
LSGTYNGRASGFSLRTAMGAVSAKSNLALANADPIEQMLTKG